MLENLKTQTKVTEEDKESIQSPEWFKNTKERKIKPGVYPDNFDTSHVRRIEVTPVEPLINYNNCVMEKPIVDPNDIKNDKKYDISKLNVDQYEDIRRLYWQ